MQTRLQAIQDPYREIENNPLNMGTNALVQSGTVARAVGSSWPQAQQALNSAVDNMDVQAAMMLTCGYHKP